MNCPSCHAEIAVGASFCSACGSPVRIASRPGLAACAVHPELAAVKTCPRCGSFTCAQCLVVLPGKVELCRRCEATGLKDFLPWDRRDELGTMRAWWQTCLKVISAPNATFSQTPREASLGSSLLFAAISNLAGIFTTALLYAVILGVALAFAPGESGQTPFKDLGAAAGLGIGVGVLLGYLVLAVVMGVVSLMFISALDYLALKAVKANPASWTVTVRGGALAMAPYLFGLIPLCGLYVFPIWSLVLKVFAYRALHRTTGGKAAAGALLPIGVMIVGLILLYAVVLIAVLTLAPDKTL